MPSRKAARQREPNGRAKRVHQQVISPGEAQRLRAAAVAGMRAQFWATPLGWLFMNDKLSGEEFAAGLRWCQVIADYERAMRGPMKPNSVNLEKRTDGFGLPGRGPIDPNTPEGRREARRDAEAVRAFNLASALLSHAGMERVRAVARVCEHNLMPVGFTELEHLRAALRMLHAAWRR